jgi:LPXTG-motif cell wall-anchored protein
LVGGEVVFRVTGCAANETLTVFFDGKPIGTVTAGETGDFSGAVSVPPGTPAGSHPVTISGATCSTSFTITVQGNLAFTGSSSHTSTYVWGAVAAIMVGLVLVVATRRRRRRLHDSSGGASTA